MTSLDLTMATTMAMVVEGQSWVIRAWHDDHLDNPVGGAIVCCHNIRKVVYPRNLPPVTIKLSIMFVLGGHCCPLGRHLGHIFMVFSTVP